MKISIVTIHRNKAEGLQRTLQSIANQLMHINPGDEVEHIIVDGESSVDVHKLLVPGLNSTIISAPPRGVYNAINVGLENITGDLVGLLHAGDIFAHPDALKTIIDRFRTGDKPDYIWGDVTIGRRYYSGKNASFKSLHSGFAPPHPSLYLRIDVLKRIGMYDESFEVAGDFDYFIRIFNDSKIRGMYLPGANINMEKGGVSNRFKNRLWTNNAERLRALRKNGLPASPLRITAHYINVIEGYLCFKKR